jgi:hypothetical protein
MEEWASGMNIHVTVAPSRDRGPINWATKLPRLQGVADTRRALCQQGRLRIKEHFPIVLGDLGIPVPNIENTI